MQKKVERFDLFEKYFDLSQHVMHQDVGGVTAGQWEIGYPVGYKDLRDNLLSYFSNKLIQPSARHILRFVKGGRPVATPLHHLSSRRKKIDGTLHPDSLVSTFRPDEEVIVPGASASGWVRRALLANEIANAFNLPAYVHFDTEWLSKEIAIAAATTPAK
eukprot:12541165-Ditylum_brightwellii.AAC.1